MTPILALPGMACDARVFAPQQAVFGDRWRSLGFLAGAAVEDQAQEALAVANALGWARFGLVGFSMGGLAAAALIEAAPGRVAGTALIGARLSACSAARAVQIDEELTQLQAGSRADLEAAFTRYARIYPDPAQGVITAMHKACSDAILIAQKQAIRDRPDRLDRVTSAPGPMAILYGARDVMSPTETRALMRAARPDAIYTEIPQAGHYPTLEQPEATTAVLADWAAALSA